MTFVVYESRGTRPLFVTNAKTAVNRFARLLVDAEIMGLDAGTIVGWATFFHGVRVAVWPASPVDVARLWLDGVRSTRGFAELPGGPGIWRRWASMRRAGFHRQEGGKP